MTTPPRPRPLFHPVLHPPSGRLLSTEPMSHDRMLAWFAQGADMGSDDETLTHIRVTSAWTRPDTFCQRLKDSVATWPNLDVRLHLLPWQWLRWRFWVDHEPRVEKSAGWLSLTIHAGPIEIDMGTNLPPFEWIGPDA